MPSKQNTLLSAQKCEHRNRLHEQRLDRVQPKGQTIITQLQQRDAEAPDVHFEGVRLMQIAVSVSLEARSAAGVNSCLIFKRAV